VGAATHDGLTPIVNRLASLARRPDPNDWDEPNARGDAQAEHEAEASDPGEREHDG
jgi:hypothetical protein